MKLIQGNPDMNLAQLAKAWKVPIDGESMKFMSSVNIKVLVSALNQKSGPDSSGSNLHCTRTILLLQIFHQDTSFCSGIEPRP